MKYIIALLAIAVGIFMVIKTESFVEMFGASAWAEEHISTSGGTRMLYKLIGLVFIILALLGATGLLGKIIIRVFGRLFGLN